MSPGRNNFLFKTKTSRPAEHTDMGTGSKHFSSVLAWIVGNSEWCNFHFHPVDSGPVNPDYEKKIIFWMLIKNMYSILEDV